MSGMVDGRYEIGLDCVRQVFLRHAAWLVLLAVIAMVLGYIYAHYKLDRWEARAEVEFANVNPDALAKAINSIRNERYFRRMANSKDVAAAFKEEKQQDVIKHLRLNVDAALADGRLTVRVVGRDAEPVAHLADRIISDALMSILELSDSSSMSGEVRALEVRLTEKSFPGDIINLAKQLALEEAYMEMLLRRYAFYQRYLVGDVLGEYLTRQELDVARERVQNMRADRRFSPLFKPNSPASDLLKLERLRHYLNAYESERVVLEEMLTKGIKNRKTASAYDVSLNPLLIGAIWVLVVIAAWGIIRFPIFCGSRTLRDT